MVIRKLAIYSFAGIILSLNIDLNANTLNKKNFIGNRYDFTKNKNFNEKTTNNKETFLADNKDINFLIYFPSVFVFIN